MADPNIDLAIEYLGGILAPETNQANYGVWVSSDGRNLQYVQSTGTTGQRPVSPPTGFIYYDTEAVVVVIWTGVGWTEISTGSLGANDTNWAIWDPSVATSHPSYATLAEAVTALGGSKAGGTVFIPVAATGLTVPASVDGNRKTSIVALGMATTITIESGAELTEFRYIGCPAQGGVLTLDDDGSATGDHLVEIEFATAGVLELENVALSGTDRALLGTGVGGSILERRVVLRGACNLPAGSVRGGSTLRIVFKDYGATIASGAIVNTSAHGRNLTLEYEDDQDYDRDDLDAGWTTGSVLHLGPLDSFKTAATNATPVAGTYVNPQVFTAADQMVVETGETGALALQPAASGHDDTPVSTITIYIKATSSVTSLSAHADYGQDGNPFDDFDAAKGYLCFITRLKNGADVSYACSGKVIAA